MRTTRLIFTCVLALVIALATQATAQAKTKVPDVVPGAKPVSVEHIKIHGTSLEGNLEGDAVDRDVIVFFRPAITNTKSAVIPCSTHCMAIR